jgi:hypothetical protein
VSQLSVAQRQSPEIRKCIERAKKKPRLGRERGCLGKTGLARFGYCQNGRATCFNLTWRERFLLWFGRLGPVRPRDLIIPLWRGYNPGFCSLCDC